MKKIAQGTIAISCALAMGVGAFSLAGCSSQTDSNASDNAQATASASQESYTFTDDLDREVTVASHNRVVAGMGSYEHLGAGRRHAGRRFQRRVFRLRHHFRRTENRRFLFA